jgi:nitrogenase subunit NifH
VLNDSNSNIDEALVVDFALHTNTEIIGNIPYSLVTDHCEYISYNPVHGSELKTQSYFYKRLANSIIEIVDTSANRQPIPMQRR